MILIVWLLIGIALGYFYSLSQKKSRPEDRAKYIFLGILGILSGVTFSNLLFGIDINYFSFISLSISYWISMILFISIRIFDNLFEFVLYKYYLKGYTYTSKVTQQVINSELITELKQKVTKDYLGINQSTKFKAT